VLNVVSSRYYTWRKGAAAAAVAKVEPAWKTALVDVFDDHYHRYGALSEAELRELGHSWVGTVRTACAVMSVNHCSLKRLSHASQI
jgi:hypothetical protein